MFYYKQILSDLEMCIIIKSCPILMSNFIMLFSYRFFGCYVKENQFPGPFRKIISKSSTKYILF